MICRRAEGPVSNTFPPLPIPEASRARARSDINQFLTHANEECNCANLPWLACFVPKHSVR